MNINPFNRASVPRRPEVIRKDQEKTQVLLDRAREKSREANRSRITSDYVREQKHQAVVRLEADMAGLEDELMRSLAYYERHQTDIDPTPEPKHTDTGMTSRGESTTPRQTPGRTYRSPAQRAYEERQREQRRWER